MKKKKSHIKMYKIFLLILLIFFIKWEKYSFNGKFSMKLYKMTELNKFESYVLN